MRLKADSLDLPGWKVLGKEVPAVLWMENSPKINPLEKTAQWKTPHGNMFVDLSGDSTSPSNEVTGIAKLAFGGLPA